MSPPALQSLCRMTGFMRLTAALVLLAFTLLILLPVEKATRQVPERLAAVAMARPDTDEDRMSQTLQDLEETVDRLDRKITQGQGHADEDRRLKALETEIRRLDERVTQGFAAVERQIRGHPLPDLILDRHRATVEQYQREMAEILRTLRLAVEAPAGERAAALGAIQRQLAEKPVRRSHHYDDPNDLPNRSLQPDPANTPRETERDFRRAGVFGNPSVRLAALGEFRFDQLPGAGDPAYLAETTEIKLTPAIRDKAAELGHDPVKIYHWVRNHLQWQPTWGAGQDAALTLSAQRGNSLEIAGLLIALLRASGIPARYVHGTLEVPAERFRNWAGGFDSTEGAVNYASSGGIPITSILSGGQIAKVRLEQVWVEAALDYVPSRGARNREADTWVPLDPSFKQYRVLSGLDPAALAGVDLTAVAESTLNSATVNTAEGWLAGLDPSALQAAQTQMHTALKDYLGQHSQNPTVGDIVGGYQILAEEFPILPGTLQNRVVAVGARYGQLPASLQNGMTYAFGADITAEPLSLPLAQLNNRRLTLSFKPATPADEQALQAPLPEGPITDVSQLPASIPAYLVQVIPELKLGGEVLKTGAAMRLGDELPFLTQVRHAGRSLPPKHYNVIAGSYLAVAADSGNISPAALQAVRDRLAHTQATLESADPTLIDGRAVSLWLPLTLRFPLLFAYWSATVNDISRACCLLSPQAPAGRCPQYSQ